MTPPPPRSTLFPYTTLFRSSSAAAGNPSEPRRTCRRLTRVPRSFGEREVGSDGGFREDRKSTRLNSSHSQISYAVFCLKKKKINMDYPIVCTTHTSTQTPL